MGISYPNLSCAIKVECFPYFVYKRTNKTLLTALCGNEKSTNSEQRKMSFQEKSDKQAIRINIALVHRPADVVNFKLRLLITN